MVPLNGENLSDDAFDRLKALSKQTSTSFPCLREVIDAHLDRVPDGHEKSKVERTIEEIVKAGSPGSTKHFRNSGKLKAFMALGMSNSADYIIGSPVRRDFRINRYL